MGQYTNKDNLHRRLRKIVGQVQAVDRMVEEGRSCEDILTQISATKAAIHSCAKIILTDYIKQCMEDGIKQGDTEKAVENFTLALDRFLSIN